MKNKSTVFFTNAGIIAALYAVTTILLAPISFGIIQIRLSEALTILPVFTPYATYGLFIGCVIGNIFGMISGASLAGIADVVIGSLATLIAAIISEKTKSFRIKNIPVISFLSPVITNTLFIGFEFALFFPQKTAFTAACLSIGAGEAISVFVSGGLLYAILQKHYPFEKQ